MGEELSPRAYRLGKRREASEATRARVIGACREILASKGAAARFSVDGVARRAGVARMTVYYQFGSKRGLLEALYDDLARRGGIVQLPQAFSLGDPVEALNKYIELFGRFWSRDRLVIRRVQGLATLDSEIEATLRERDQWRTAGLSVLVHRLHPNETDAALSETVGILHALTSFATFDALAGERLPADVVPLVQRLARLVVALPDA